jgi:F0F1-type ATP synthase assembly protein I
MLSEIISLCFGTLLYFLTAIVIILIITISVLAALMGTLAAEASRGYSAIGGEIFIIPAGVFVAWAFNRYFNPKKKVYKFYTKEEYFNLSGTGLKVIQGGR